MKGDLNHLKKQKSGKVHIPQELLMSQHHCRSLLNSVLREYNILNVPDQISRYLPL